MPARQSFWVILIGSTATSFRAKEREDLVPTLRQLQRTQSDVTLRWFERGRIWESPEAAIGAAKLAATEARERRTKEWRPGGEHKDPKARFELTRDQKRARFKRERPPFDPERSGRPKPDRSEGSNRPQSPFGPRAPRPDRARTESPFPKRGPRQPGGESRERPGGRSRPPSEDRPFRDRPPRRDRPSGPMENPFKDRRRPEDRSGPRPDRRPHPGRPTGPKRPGGDRGGFKPPKRRP